MIMKDYVRDALTAFTDMYDVTVQIDDGHNPYEMRVIFRQGNFAEGYTILLLGTIDEMHKKIQCILKDVVIGLDLQKKPTSYRDEMTLKIKEIGRELIRRADSIVPDDICGTEVIRIFSEIANDSIPEVKWTITTPCITRSININN